jgi:hypothetical protein
MSPRRVKLPTCVVEFGIAVIDGDVSIERFNELNFCPGEAEAMRLGRNLEVAAVPLDNVVVADAALMEEAADTVQVFGSGTPGFLGFARHTSKAAVVVGQEAAKDLVGGVKIGSTGHAQFVSEHWSAGAGAYRSYRYRPLALQYPLGSGGRTQISEI